MGRIDKMGVELEGFWNREKWGIAPYGTEYNELSDLVEEGDLSGQNIHNDGSLSYMTLDERDYLCCEVVSPPRKLATLLQWLEKYYPCAVNASCGFHIHVSLKKNLDYQKLMCEKFYEYFLFRFKKWGKKNEILKDSQFWKRLAGNNSYCKAEYRADLQAQATDKTGARYAQLNYCFSFHGTLESRLLPMFKKKELAISAVKEFADIVETFLIRYGKEEPSNVNLVLDDENQNVEEENKDLDFSKEVKLEKIEEVLFI